MQENVKNAKVIFRRKFVTGEFMYVLKGSCSQNTLKNERLEHCGYRQEINFIDRERLSGETYSGVQKPGAPRVLEWGLYI
jgi:hypothetical protein